MSLWNADAAMQAMAATLVGEGRPITGISIDTRTLQPGDLFFAIQGEARDGHEFVAAALQKGAAGAVVLRDRVTNFVGQGALYAVDDVLGALVALGRAARGRTQARIVAVTGSVGKTGTKEALKALLEKQGRTHASVASYNNHWGVPLTLARMPADTAFGIFEIGMNHANEISPLVKMVQPHVAVITAIAPVHLENLGSIEAIADAKGEIFDGLEPDGVAIIPGDSPYAPRLAGHVARNHIKHLVQFGEAASCDPRLVSLVLDADGSDAAVDMKGVTRRMRFGSPGRHVALNGLAVLAAIDALGGDVARAAHDFATVTPPTGRGQRHVLGPITLVDESYNANPASMRAAFSVLASMKVDGRRIVALGDMLELGAEEAAMHRALAHPLAEAHVDLVFAAGERMKHLFEALPLETRGAWAETAQALTPYVLEALREGDVIMVKGSNSSRMSTLVSAIKQRFEPSRQGEEA